MIFTGLYSEGENGEIEELGEHPFIAVPRVGEHVLIEAGQRPRRMVVTDVMNYSARSTAGKNDPHIRLRVMPN